MTQLYSLVTQSTINLRPSTFPMLIASVYLPANTTNLISDCIRLLITISLRAALSLSPTNTRSYLNEDRR